MHTGSVRPNRSGYLVHETRPSLFVASRTKQVDCGKQVQRGLGHQQHGFCSLHTHQRGASLTTAAGGGPSFETGMSPQLRSAVDVMVKEHKIVLFMKGTPQFPQCGFSNTCIQILNTLGAPYETVNILESDLLRQGMKEYSQWPTFPQCYIDGEFFGGCDIMIEAYTNGELQEVVEAAINS